ncbi:hypothetical protein HG535_0A00470 [Zygotorulaspora mrakii]|uniref:Mitochondrial inner membrane i-AAA protease complex subunit MGR1 n=1 Tax=Zygotorulaspora mrakii TaxID=42260 RepID=A0A7H9AV23_ZYGMR|nr:uncharacterized protein HG535_0A00470 [Zygotorulaspora mrakii]QLG70108.1 hypothetical protein HG535_0A00470 [Zygotorulaspora mrakii]
MISRLFAYTTVFRFHFQPKWAHEKWRNIEEGSQNIKLLELNKAFRTKIIRVMALYTPPGKPSSRPSAGESINDSRDDPKDDSKKFYVRPSLGLRIWGPLVPASDNKMGLWSLVGAQTIVGLFCMYRLRGLRGPTKSLRRDIADIPSLNRFSTTHGEILASPVPAAMGHVRVGNTASVVNGGKVLGTTFGGASSFFKSKAQGTGQGFFKSAGVIAFRKVLYLLTGTLLLSQSLLETCRLTILKYDPWVEEAKSVREKQFYNDIIQFYHEGIDPTKIRVKDAKSGDVMSTNIPEVRQSVALVRAQSEAQNPIIRWYGPLEYQPMSFTEYLDRLEYHLDMADFLQDKRNVKESTIQVMKKLTHTQGESEQIIKINEKNRRELLNITSNVDKGTMPLSSNVQQYPSRGIVMDVNQDSPEKVDLEETWNLYDPWMNLAFDTSLSIKFLPTLMTPNDIMDGKSKERNDSNDDKEPKAE